MVEGAVDRSYVQSPTAHGLQVAPHKKGDPVAGPLHPRAVIRTDRTRTNHADFPKYN